MTTVDDLRGKKPTREEIADLLKTIGKPGQKREEKLAAVQSLELKNNQGHELEMTLDSYEGW